MGTVKTLIAGDPDWDWDAARERYRTQYRHEITTVGRVLRSPILRVFGTIGGAKLGGNS